jgi:hypothetical protein
VWHRKTAVGAHKVFFDEPDQSFAANGGGDGIDEIGVDINYGFGYGYKTPFGSAQVKIGNAKVWSLKYSNSKIQKRGFMQDSDMLMFSYQRSIPLINLGFGLTLHSESGIDLYGTFGPWNFGTENGLIVDGTYGFHLGIIGAEGYIRTSDTQSFIQSIPNARQQFYETTGFMWNLR